MMIAGTIYIIAVAALIIAALVVPAGIKFLGYVLAERFERSPRGRLYAGIVLGVMLGSFGLAVGLLAAGVI